MWNVMFIAHNNKKTVSFVICLDVCHQNNDIFVCLK